MIFPEVLVLSVMAVQFFRQNFNLISQKVPVVMNNILVVGPRNHANLDPPLERQRVFAKRNSGCRNRVRLFNKDVARGRPVNRV